MSCDQWPLTITVGDVPFPPRSGDQHRPSSHYASALPLSQAQPVSGVLYGTLNSDGFYMSIYIRIDEI